MEKWKHLLTFRNFIRIMIYKFFCLFIFLSPLLLRMLDIVSLIKTSFALFAESLFVERGVILAGECLLVSSILFVW